MGLIVFAFMLLIILLMIVVLYLGYIPRFF